MTALTMSAAELLQALTEWNYLSEVERHVEGLVAEIEAFAAGELTHPVSTQRLMEYWAHGKGAAKINWARSCAFCRCLEHLTKYFPKNPRGLCHNLEVRATGHRPNIENSRTKHCPC
jgi:hypothetical protein